MRLFVPLQIIFFFFIWEPGFSMGPLLLLEKRILYPHQEKKRGGKETMIATGEHKKAD